MYNVRTNSVHYKSNKMLRNKYNIFFINQNHNIDQQKHKLSYIKQIYREKNLKHVSIASSIQISVPVYFRKYQRYGSLITYIMVIFTFRLFWS